MSGWSKDPSTKVGTVIARPDKSICSVGFNGLPMGVEDTAERLNDRALKYPMTLHGEVNALSFARDQSLEGYTLYNVPFMPCSRCAGQIIQKKITRVVAPWSDNPRWSEDFEIAMKMFSEAKTILEFYAGSLEIDNDEKTEQDKEEKSESTIKTIGT